MRIVSNDLAGVLLIELDVFSDERGEFYESWNQKKFDELIGESVTFYQDNQSYSKVNVLRGLHYQLENPQGKLVRVLQGRVFDVVVDIRKNSPTLGQWVGYELSEENQNILWIPEGFAHGFKVLSENGARFLYKTTNYYSPKSEQCIKWNDIDIGVVWPCEDAVVVSEKDSKGVDFIDAILMDGY